MNGFCNDYFAIVSGESSRFSQAYREATESVEKSTPKGLAQLKSFITAIEEISKKDGVKDSRISSSHGNITQFSGYDNIKTAMEFIKKNLGGIEIFKDVNVIYKTLVDNASLYSEGYSKNIRLIVLEYESAVYLVVTGLSMVMATNMDVVQNGTSISIQKKSGTSYGETGKCIKDLAKQMGSSHHKDYLEAMIKSKEMNASGENPKKKEQDEPKEEPKEKNVNESYDFFMEATVADTVELLDTMVSSIGALGRFAKRTFIGLKNSIFGIVPLIRSILYLRYKKKADTVLALDQQCKFIQQNIEQLQNMKTMDPAKKEMVIKRQKATIEAYQKKAAKLRAQLCDGERDSTDEAKKDEPKISRQANDDDFVLESTGLAAFNEASESADKYINFIDVVSGNNKKLMDEFQEYWDDFDAWSKKPKSDAMNRSTADNSSQARKHNYAMQFALQLLSEKNLVASMDWKAGLKDYVFIMKKAFHAHHISANVAWDKITADNAPEITSQMNDLLRDKGITIIDIYTDTDSYDLIPCINRDALNAIKGAAKKAGSKGRLPKKSGNNNYVFESTN